MSKDQLGIAIVAGFGISVSHEGDNHGLCQRHAFGHSACMIDALSLDRCVGNDALFARAEGLNYEIRCHVPTSLTREFANS